MKTVKKDGVVKRVSDDLAEKLIEQGWNYCPKKEYKDSKK